MDFINVLGICIFTPLNMSKQKQKLLSDWFTKEYKVITNNDLNHMNSAVKSGKTLEITNVICNNYRTL